MGIKKGLNTKIITVFNPDNDDDFELFVTYEILDSDLNDDDDTYYNVDGDVDIKSYESNNDEDMPEWVTEDLVYSSLFEELELEEEDEENIIDDEHFEDYENDFMENEEDDDYYHSDSGTGAGDRCRRRGRRCRRRNRCRHCIPV
jgi:hypothetical protein